MRQLHFAKVSLGRNWQAMSRVLRETQTEVDEGERATGVRAVVCSLHGENGGKKAWRRLGREDETLGDTRDHCE